jgi:pyridoxamine 5'-phosphate oxidase
VEFWQGRKGRMHDRLVYRRSAADGWTVERLAP